MMAETCHYNSPYSYFIARLGWRIDGCAKCSLMNHTAQLTTRNIPWNFPCYCNAFVPRVFISCWMSSWIYLTTLQTSLLPVFATRFCGFHRHTADAIYQNALLSNELHLLIIKCKLDLTDAKCVRFYVLLFMALSITQVILLYKGRTPNN